MVQFVLIGILAAALHEYFSPRRGHRATVNTLLMAELISFLPVGLCTLVELVMPSEGRKDYPGWLCVLFAYFELYGFAVVSFVALVVGGLTLYCRSDESTSG